MGETRRRSIGEALGMGVSRTVAGTAEGGGLAPTVERILRRDRGADGSGSASHAHWFTGPTPAADLDFELPDPDALWLVGGSVSWVLEVDPVTARTLAVVTATWSGPFIEGAFWGGGAERTYPIPPSASTTEVFLDGVFTPSLATGTNHLTAGIDAATYPVDDATVATWPYGVPCTVSGHVTLWGIQIA